MPEPAGAAIALSDELFRLLRDYIQKLCGIYFKDTNKFLLERRLLQRVKALQFQSFEQYYYYLTYDPRSAQEKDALFDVITTNETYFYRELKQLTAFIDEIVPQVLAVKPKLRVWSAGCSTGEEPYTLAMLLDERGWFDRGLIDIYASDISQEAIQKARKGLYRENSFRTTTPEHRARYLEEVSPGLYKVRDAIKHKVAFGCLNLLDLSRIYLLGYLDVIFCRNVIIYFDDESKKWAIDMFYDRLYPGGHLLLGHSESLISISTKFKLHHFKNDMVYKK
jgi:chemotaxis protein methyltransferase CheR